MTRIRAALRSLQHSDAVSPYLEAMKHDLAPFTTGRLRRRLRFLLVLGSVLVMMALSHVVTQPIGAALALTGAGMGLGLGLLMGRISRFSWDPTATRVTARMDALGAVLLVTYIIIAMQRREFLGHWLTADTLATVSLAMTGGTLLGRNFAMRKGIAGILKEAGLIPSPLAGNGGPEVAF